MPPAASRKAAIIAKPSAPEAIVPIRLSLHRNLTALAPLSRSMKPEQQQARLEEAFERIEETILPCIAMMLETLLDASAGVGETDPRALAAELRTLAAQLEEVTR